MSVLDTDAASRHEREKIAAILGCRMVDGVCVRHQSRPWEPRRPGCPFADAVMRQGRDAGAPSDR
jgi:hypothetical protein